jgi:hypothetical protein
MSLAPQLQRGLAILGASIACQIVDPAYAAASLSGAIETILNTTPRSPAQ